MSADDARRKSQPRDAKGPAVRADLDASADRGDSDRGDAGLDRGSAARLTGHEQQDGEYERRAENDQDLDGPADQAGVGDDLSEVDRKRDEKEPGERGGRTRGSREREAPVTEGVSVQAGR